MGKGNTMAKVVKSIKVAALVESVNYRNRVSTCDPRVRNGWNVLLEEVLAATGNYAGFSYLTAKELEESAIGHLPGITTGVEPPIFLDPTRRQYHFKR